MRRILVLVLKEQGPTTSALQLAGKSVGKFAKGPTDLSTNKEHLDGFGQ